LRIETFTRKSEIFSQRYATSRQASHRTLYAIFTADIPKPDQTKIALYADGTAILTRSWSPVVITERLQRAVKSLETWFRLWRIDVYPDKSSAILFTRRRLHRPVGEIVMFDQPIPWKNEVRYHGISFDNYLRFNAQLEHAKTRGQMVRGQLNSLVNLRSGGTCPTRNSRSCRSCRINSFERLSTPRGSSGILNSIEKRTSQPTKNSCRMMHGNAMRKRLYSPGTVAT
jgi:hypothetical protein